MTSCESCRRFELTRWQRLREDVMSTLFRDGTADAIAASGRSTSAMLGAATGRKQVSGYDFHRERYERTGSELERIRMLRHLS
jgi:hypothetical protein